MSSSRLARPWSLRARLIAEQLVLLGLVCVVIGLATVFALRTFMIQRLDSELTEASVRASGFVERGPPRPGDGQPPPDGRPTDGQPPPDRQQPGPDGLPPPRPIDAPGQGPGTINALIDQTGTVRSADQQTSTGARETLPDSLYPALKDLPVDRRARTVELEGLGSYRMMAVWSTDGQFVVITGLPLSDVDATQVNVALVLGAVSLLGLTAAGVAGVLIVRRTLRPLDRVAATARRVAQLPLDRGEVQLPDRVPAADTNPNTEVGQVGSALNHMLGHISAALAARHASETRVRQFVADASHELRTPLTAIRGYSELAGRAEAVPPEVQHAVSRVESEANRMTTLVEDLLLLARLDSGRPLLQETVDLSRLVVDTVGDARVAGPSHHWRLDLPTEPVLASGDQARLHQVVANLLANSRTHTPPGTTVTAGLRRNGEHAILTVTDNGPGIPSQLLPEVFERFARGDSSRSRAAGSTGLGLAIVSAVVHAHHGTVEVASTAGHTEFTVRIPTASTDAGSE